MSMFIIILVHMHIPVEGVIWAQKNLRTYKEFEKNPPRENSGSDTHSEHAEHNSYPYHYYHVVPVLGVASYPSKLILYSYPQPSKGCFLV